MKALWGKIKKKQLVRNTLWMLLGDGAGTAIQAIYFVIIARALGSQGYGTIMGVSALVGILAPFASLGSGNILIKHVARDGATFSKYWGRAIVLTVASGLLLTMLALVLSSFLLPAAIPILLVLCLSISSLIFSALLGVSAQAFQGFQRMAETSAIMFLPSILRLIGLLTLICLKKPTPLDLGYVYLASTALATMISFCYVKRELGKPIYDKKVFNVEIKEGMYFSIGLSSQGVYNDIDKTMLARLATLEDVGIYAAAYRIIDVAFRPVRSLYFATYARFFQSGASGLRGTLIFVVRLLPYVAGYGLAVSFLLFVSAPIMPYVFGRDFADAVLALRWLSLLPLLKVLHCFPADSLTGAGFQGARSCCQVATAVLNVLLNLWLIPIYSWKGAAWASLASDGMQIVFMWGAVWWKSKSKCEDVMVASDK